MAHRNDMYAVAIRAYEQSKNCTMLSFRRKPVAADSGEIAPQFPLFAAVHFRVAECAPYFFPKGDQHSCVIVIVNVDSAQGDQIVSEISRAKVDGRRTL
jgi:hypothetical protein